jgi:hypothetical protein
MSRMSENVGASTSRNPKGLHGLYRDNFTLPYMFWNLVLDILRIKGWWRIVEQNFWQCPPNTACVVYWSEFLATDAEISGSIPGATRFWEVVGLERGPLSLVSITEELLEWKSSGSGSGKSILTAVGIRCADHATPSLRKSLVHLRTKSYGVQF